jgi:hypothetical protein
VIAKISLNYHNFGIYGRYIELDDGLINQQTQLGGLTLYVKPRLIKFLFINRGTTFHGKFVNDFFKNIIFNKFGGSSHVYNQYNYDY